MPGATPAIAAPTACQELRYPVTVPGATGQFIAGTLCVPKGATRVQVLVPGGTYNQTYWEYRPEGAPSVREAMNAAGIATLNVDRLGTGKSSKPLSALILSDVSAATIHQVIQQVRPRFAKVVLIAHSVGAGAARIEAATYKDVDGLVITGLTHLIDAVDILPVFTTLIPVQVARAADARAKAWGLDAGYLTTTPGSRYRDFHRPSVEPRAAIDYDETNWDAFSAAEAPGVVAEAMPLTTRSRQVTASTLMVMGENDIALCGLGPLDKPIPLFGGLQVKFLSKVGSKIGADCTSSEALVRSEKPFYPNARSFDAFVVRGAGHSINFGTQAPTQYPVVSNWTNGL
ncbi:alpha/beta hydrolase [Pseudonocardiaceae bacterium YIM PH 21723]|nr:alpha/beta hydrolase [Pseudonocardiaceae bacterium YIM PH 21723]